MKNNSSIFRAVRITLLTALIFCLSVPVMAAAEPPGKNTGAVLESAKAVSARKKGIESRAWKKINGVCYNGSGEVIPGAITRGIDVSEWQGTIDWKKVKNSDVDFAFIRLSHSLKHEDVQYDYNMKNAIASGIPVGVYLYSTATTEAEVLREAQYLIRRIRGYKISYPIVYDMEDESASGLTVAQRTNLVTTFCEEIKKAGYYPMVYTNIYWYLTQLNMAKLKSYDVWLARYGDTINRPSSEYRYTIWQATGGDYTPGMKTTKGLIDGIPIVNNADVNFGFVDYTKIINPRTQPLDSYTETVVVENGWAVEDGETYYYVNGKKVKGALKLGDKEYRFSAADGRLFVNKLLYSSKSGKTYYCGEDGAIVKSRWVTWKGKKYYFGKDGLAYKGSRKVKGKFYWFDSKKGFMKKNVKYISKAGKVYYYGKNGVRVNSGFTEIVENGKTNTYYFSKSGAAYKGWHRIRGKQYYFYVGMDSRTGVRAENTTINIKDEICTFDENGVCVSREPA